MAIQSATASSLSLLMRQQAMRSADQLEARATALADQAEKARKDADRAQQRADTLETKASQAQSRAELGRIALNASEGVERMGDNLQTTLTRAVQSVDGTEGVLYTPSASETTVSAAPVGQVIDITA